MKKLIMFVITHKNIFLNLKKEFKYIKVGDNPNLKINLTDNTGNNIAFKNKNYCELTAMYWIWKNYKLPDYIGICHYRRFFQKKHSLKLMDEKSVNKIMNNYDVVLPNKWKTESTVKRHFLDNGVGKERDLENLKKIIRENSKEYLEDYLSIMNGDSASYCNMCVMKRDDYISYCEWLFNILFKLEEITDLTGYNDTQRRLYGFLSEFLLNVWVRHNNLNVYYSYIYRIEENKLKNIIRKIRGVFK